MSEVSNKLVRFLEDAFERVFQKKDLSEMSDSLEISKCSFEYKTLEEYTEAGNRFRRTKSQMERNLPREEAFEEYKQQKIEGKENVSPN